MHYLDNFVAGVPAGALFKMNFKDLINVVDSSVNHESGLNTVAEVCLVALVSYFEAFCKNNFASIINICPKVVINIEKTRKDITFDIEELNAVNFDLKEKIGFLISEKLDFGTAKNINSLYLEILKFTPFSKDEISQYDDLLNNRNLLVHHGGIYTLKYGKQNQTIRKQAFKGRFFFDSLVIRKNDFKLWAEFVEGIVIKIINKSNENLLEFINSNKYKLKPEAIKAVEAIKWYD